MKLVDYYKLLTNNQEKLSVIDEITEFHPGYGTGLGWSWYVGGMQDSGGWNNEVLLNTPIEFLSTQLNVWKKQKEEANQRKEEWDKKSPEEKVRLTKEQFENFKKEHERNLMWGK
jgi:hypothetical protein